MKKQLFALLLVLSLSHLLAAQEITEETPAIRKTSVTLVPQSFFASGLEAAGERMFGSNASVKVYAAYYTAEDHWWYEEAESMTGFKLDVQPRIYINSEDRGVEGFFFGGSLNYRSTFLNEYKEFNSSIIKDVNASAFGLGFIFGQQVVANSGFTLDWFVGGNLITPLSTFDTEAVHMSIVNPYKRGIVPRLGLSIGYAF